MSTGKHFLSKHRTITMLVLFIKIETFHGFVIALKAEQNLKRFFPFYTPDLFSLCLLFQCRNVAILFNYKVASGLNEQHGKLFKTGGNTIFLFSCFQPFIWLLQILKRIIVYFP